MRLQMSKLISSRFYTSSSDEWYMEMVPLPEVEDTLNAWKKKKKQKPKKKSEEEKEAEEKQ